MCLSLANITLSVISTNIPVDKWQGIWGSVLDGCISCGGNITLFKAYLSLGEQDCASQPT
jgi:hypothetical protein